MISSRPCSSISLRGSRYLNKYVQLGGDSFPTRIGATVSNGINICQDCMIGAGAVVVRDMETPGTYIGVPARKLR